jgi:hypothetical protein
MGGAGDLTRSLPTKGLKSLLPIVFLDKRPVSVIPVSKAG